MLRNSPLQSGILESLDQNSLSPVSSIWFCPKLSQTPVSDFRFFIFFTTRKIWSTFRATPNQLFRWTFTPLAYTRRKRPQFLIISRSLSPKMNHQTNRSFKFPSPLLTKTLFSSPLSSFLQSNRTSSLPFWSSNARIRTVPSSRNYSLFSSWAWIFTQKPNNYQNCKKTSSKSCTNLPCPMFISVSFSNL